MLDTPLPDIQHRSKLSIVQTPVAPEKPGIEIVSWGGEFAAENALCETVRISCKELSWGTVSIANRQVQSIAILTLVGSHVTVAGTDFFVQRDAVSPGTLGAYSLLYRAQTLLGRCRGLSCPCNNRATAAFVQLANVSKLMGQRDPADSSNHNLSVRIPRVSIVTRWQAEQGVFSTPSERRCRGCSGRSYS